MEAETPHFRDFGLEAKDYEKTSITNNHYFTSSLSC